MEIVCQHLFGDHGLASDHLPEVSATYTAVRSLIQDNVQVAAAALLPRIEQSLDRRDADALSPAEITILKTPEGLEYNFVSLASRKPKKHSTCLPT